MKRLRWFSVMRLARVSPYFSANRARSRSMPSLISSGKNGVQRATGRPAVAEYSIMAWPLPSSRPWPVELRGMSGHIVAM